MFGTTSRSRIALTLSPRATAASTNARTDCSSVAERTTRAISGACTIATAATSVPLLVPAPVTSTRMKSSAGTATTTSTPRMTTASKRPCVYPHSSPIAAPRA